MTKVIVRYSTNWADEADFEGFRIYEKSFWDNFVAFWKEAMPEDKRYTIDFGTNEYNEECGPGGLLRDISVQEIDEADEAIILKYFSKGEGYFPSIDGFIEDAIGYWEADIDSDVKVVFDDARYGYEESDRAIGESLQLWVDGWRPGDGIPEGWTIRKR